MAIAGPSEWQLVEFDDRSDLHLGVEDDMAVQSDLCHLMVLERPCGDALATELVSRGLKGRAGTGRPEFSGRAIREVDETAGDVIERGRGATLLHV